MPVFVLHSAFTVFALLLALSGLLPPQTATVRVDMQVSAGTSTELFLNDLRRPPLARKLSPGERKTYEFSGISEDLGLIRLDPTNVPRAEVCIYSLEVAAAGRVLRRFAPQALARWSAHGVEDQFLTDRALCFLAAGNDPMLTTTERVPVPRTTPVWLDSIIGDIATPQYVIWILVWACLMLVLVGVLDPVRWAHLFVIVIVFLTTGPLVRWITSSCHSLTSIDVAVNRANFLGLSTRANIYATVAILLAGAAAGVIAHLLCRPLRRYPFFDCRLDTDKIPPIGPFSQWRRLAVALSIGAVVCAACPDFREVFHGMATAQFYPQWDSNNITYWAYLTHNGYVPFRDFWYPYAGLHIFNTPAPWGVLASFLYQSFVHVLFFYIFYRLSGNRVMVGLTVTALLMIGGRLNVFPHMFRYLLAPAIAFTYTLIDRNEGRCGASHVWFWVVVCIALFFDPPQLIYAAGFLVLKFGLDIRISRSPGGRAAVRRAVREFGPPAAFALLYGIWMASSGRLSGFLTLYLRLGDSAAYGALPKDLTTAMAASNFQLVVLALPGVLIGIAAFERLRASGTETRFADALLGLGLVSFMVLQKDVIRRMDEQLSVFVGLAAVTYLSFRLRHLSRTELFALGGTLGACAAVLTMGGALSVASYLLGGPRRLLEAPATMVDTPLIQKANRERFAPARFAQFPGQIRLAEHLRALNGGIAPTVFHLTDDPVLYILTGQEPVYYSNLYNASPIYEQRRLASWLRSERPTFVVFDVAYLEMDGFDKSVRTPLVFGAVLENYVPQESFRGVEILRRREHGEPVPVAYWREKLGATINLGHLPRISSFERFRACAESSANGCHEFLEVRVARADAVPEAVSIFAEAEGQRFEIKFTAIANQGTYHVLLDRLWFWGGLKRAGVPVCLADDEQRSGMSISVVLRARQYDILY